jgi:predicted CopG family antitoxin
VVRHITLSNGAYDDLNSLKAENESFSDAVEKLIIEKRHKGLLRLAGIWKNKPEITRIMREIEGSVLTSNSR